MSFLLAIFIALGTAFVCSEALKKLGIPRVVGQILAGVILGLPLLRALFYTEEIATGFTELANVAMVLLFFFIGLEMNLRSLKKDVKEALLTSLFSTFVPVLSGILISHFLGFDLVVGIILGINFAVSSQSITFDLLEEFSLLKSRIARLIVAAGALDDVIEFILIGLLLTFIQISAVQASPLTVLWNIALFAGGVALFKFLLVPFLLKLFDREESPVALFMGAIIITMLMAYLSELLGMSGLLGAFIAGVIMRQILLSGEHRPWEEHSLANTLRVVSFGFLMPLFFVWVGLSIGLPEEIHNWALAIPLGLAAIATTVLGSWLGVRLSGHGNKEGLLMGLGVSSKGDVELAIASLALSNGIISRDLFSIFVLMAVVTTLVAPVLFRHFAKKWSAEMKE